MADRFFEFRGVAAGELSMKKRGSAVAAGGPAREQAREAVPVEARRAGRARCREVRDASAARQPSRWLCACVLAEVEARVEAVPKA